MNSVHQHINVLLICFIKMNGFSIVNVLCWLLTFVIFTSCVSSVSTVSSGLIFDITLMSLPVLFWRLVPCLAFYIFLVIFPAPVIVLIESLPLCAFVTVFLGTKQISLLLSSLSFGFFGNFSNNFTVSLQYLLFFKTHFMHTPSN